MWWLLFFFIFFPQPVHAEGEFNVTQTIVFDVDSSGTAHVNQSVNLVNNYSQIYPKEYQINLTGSTLSQIQGSDTGGNIVTQNKTNGDTTTIDLIPNSPGVGKDQSTLLNLNYSITNFAQKKGNTWEIQVPQYQAASSDNFDITLKIPSTFGQLSFSSIPIVSSHDLSTYSEIKFNQNSIKNKILLVFGNHQLVDFSLKYYLENNSQVVKNTEIAIPPDTNNQTIHYRQISPQPLNVKVDADGNWLALYRLNPQQKINITVSGQAKITSWHPLTENIDNSKYLTPQKYWETNNPDLQVIATNLRTSKQIYDYVVKNLNYNFSQIDGSSRHGALYAIQNPDNSLCTEFTDLFVTLARIQNIPAREVEGYAFSNNTKIKPLNPNSDILHAWPQYYNATTKSWMAVDPTWEKTTNGIDYFSDLDLSHLTFVIHGLSSVYPPPPGSYKPPEATKSIDTSFATEEIKNDPEPPQLTFKDNQLTITNPNLSSLNQVVVNLPNHWQKNLGVLPPLSVVNISLPPTSFKDILSPQNRNYTFSITSAEFPDSFSQTIINRQYYLFLSLAIAGGIVILSLGGIIITIEKNT